MRRIKLCDICDFQGGSQPPKNQWIDSPQYGYIRMLQIRDFTQSEKVKPEYIKITSSSKVCNEDDILIARYGASVGKILTGLAGAYNVAIMKTIPDEEKISKRFLFYFLSSQYFQNYIMNVGSRAAQAGFNKDDLQGISLKEYSLKEQADICSILDEINVIIKKRKKQLKYIENVVKSRFIEMFGTLHNNENGFDIVTLDEVCSLIKDGTHQTPQYTENRIEGYKFLSSKDVMSQKIDWTDIKYIPEELHKKLYAVIRPQRNDILMSKNGVNYGVAAVNDTDEIFDIYVSLALLRPKAVIDPVFLRCIINNPETKKQFSASIKGIGVPNLHLGEIKKTKIFLPPMELQKEFVAFVAQTDKSKYYNFTSYKYCVLAAKLIRQEWMLCQTLSF